VAFARQREGVALGGVEIAEQAPDRPVDIEIDIHLFLIDEAFARVQAQHLTDKKLAAGSEGECDMLPALERERCRCQTRHRDIDRRQCLQPRRLHLAVTGRKVDRAVVHGRRQRLVHQMHDELPAAVDVARGVLGLKSALCCRPSTRRGGSSEKTLKKLNGAALTLPFSSSVVTSAIGRGTTTPHSSL
jgi:hypothetical protein